jgi:transcriptional regulator GlxA family with amidase domain
MGCAEVFSESAQWTTWRTARAPLDLSRAHFIRSFRAAFGETPHRYLQRRRIERAMDMLRNTNKTVTEIARFRLHGKAWNRPSKHFRRSAEG